ncbi:MAG: murein biosynthesis integral membrane protein MurJ [Acidimicrobiales bacterium]|nr:murein biosynthesis integral membrane protein MurJ [Acidimicrobiales bacterium]
MSGEGPQQPPATRGSSAVAGGIFLSRVAGLLREALLRSVLGLGPAADAFAAALRIPNVLQNLLGEGSLSASFIPVYSRLLSEDHEREAGRVAGAVAGLLTALAGALALLGILLARPLALLLAPGFSDETLDLTVDLVRITTAGVGFLVLSAWCLGVLNSHRRFFLSYVAPVLWNAAQIAVLAAAILGSWDPADAARALAWGLVAGGALQFGVQAVAVARLVPGIRVSLGARLPSVAEIRRRFGPAVLGRGVVQLSAYLDLILASLLVTGAVAGLLSAQMLYALPISLFAMSVAASELPEMSRAEDPALLVSRCRSALRRTAFFVSFAAVAYVVAGEAIVGALFRWGAFDADDTRAVWLVLAAYSLGLPAIGASRIFQNTLYSIGDTRGPARIAATRVVVAGIVGVVFMFPMDHVSVVAGSLSGLENVFSPDGAHVDIPGALGAPHLGAVGLALGSAVAAWLELALLTRLGRRTVEGFPSALEALRQLLPAVAVAVPMTLLLATTTAGLAPQVSAPLILGVAGVTYTAIAHLTGVDEAQLLFRRVLRSRRG